MTFILNFANSKRNRKNFESKWHEALLQGYLKSSTDASRFNLRALSSADLLGLLPRPWWSDTILQDGYIHAHVARHLSLCGRGSELAALLTDARWMIERGKLGGVLGLKADFEILDKLFRIGRRTGEYVVLKSIQESFQMISTAIQLSWGRFFEGRRAFQFQMCGRCGV